MGDPNGTASDVTRPRRARRSTALAAVVVLAMTGALTACQFNAVPGARCGPEGDFGLGRGDDAGNTYQCVGGRWRWSMTTAQAAQLLKAAKDAQAAQEAAAAAAAAQAAQAPAPPPAPSVPIDGPAGPELSGCYNTDVDYRLSHPAGGAAWYYVAQFHSSTNRTCSGPARTDVVGVAVYASGTPQAAARCTAGMGRAATSNRLFDATEPALAGLYGCEPA